MKSFAKSLIAEASDANREGGGVGEGLAQPRDWQILTQESSGKKQNFY